MKLEIRKLFFADIEEASRLLAASFINDNGIIALFKENDDKYPAKVNLWFSATLKMLITNKQLINGAYMNDVLVGVSLVTRSTFEPSAQSMLKWIFTVLFSCGLGTVIKSAKHDQQRKPYFTNKNQYILEFIAVNPSHRGKGIGKGLFSNLHHFAKGTGSTVWLETTKEKNIKIFQKMGYNLIGEKYELSVKYYMMTNEKVAHNAKESIMSKNAIRNENNNVPVRQANVKDCVEAAKLIFMTGEEIFKYAFYPEMDKVLIILRQLFQMETNEFTHKNAYIAEIDGQIAGLILFVDQKDMKKNKNEMGRKVIKLMGYFQTLKRIYRFAHVERLIGKIDERTLYIKHLATFKEFRGKGIATGLLAFCEQQSEKRGFSKLALDVETGNTTAIQFYENIGFRVVQEIKSNRFYERSDFNIYRMIKEVPHSDNALSSQK